MKNFMLEVEYDSDDCVLYIANDGSSGVRSEAVKTKEDIVRCIKNYIECYLEEEGE